MDEHIWRCRIVDERDRGGDGNNWRQDLLQHIVPAVPYFRVLVEGFFFL